MLRFLFDVRIRSVARFLRRLVHVREQLEACG